MSGYNTIRSDYQNHQIKATICIPKRRTARCSSPSRQPGRQQRQRRRARTRVVQRLGGLGGTFLSDSVTALWVVGGLGETVTPHVAQSYRFEGWIETCTCDEMSVSYVVCQRHVPTAIGMYSRNRRFPGASLVLKLYAVPRIERIQYQFCVSHLNEAK